MKQTEFEERVTAMTDDMYRVAAGMLFRYADRQDAVQECIWKAWRQLDRLRDESAFRPWLMRILVNECRNLQRKSKREVAAEYIEISSTEMLMMIVRGTKFCMMRCKSCLKKCD